MLSLSEEIFDMCITESILGKKHFDVSKYIKTKLKISSEMAFRVYDEISKFKIDENGDFICELFLPDINTICTYVFRRILQNSAAWAGSKGNEKTFEKSFAKLYIIWHTDVILIDV